MPYEYMETVARYYDAVSTGIPGDVAYFTDLARGCGGPVLELGCWDRAHNRAHRGGRRTHRRAGLVPGHAVW